MSKIKFEIKNNVPFLLPSSYNEYISNPTLSEKIVQKLLTPKLLDKVLVISGKGELNQIDSQSIIFLGEVTKKSDIKHVIIKPGITKIGDSVFNQSFKKLKTIIIPETVTEIGYEPFANSEIEKLIYPDFLDEQIKSLNYLTADFEPFKPLPRASNNARKNNSPSGLPPGFESNSTKSKFKSKSKSKSKKKNSKGTNKSQKKLPPELPPGF